MDKLFNYSKIVSCIALLTTIVCVASFCVGNSALTYTLFGFTVALFISISLWFGIIAIKSVKGSSLKLPSILGTIFSFTIIITSIVLSVIKFDDMDISSFLRKMHTLSYLKSIGGIGLGIVFIRLSNFFKKKLINTLAMALGVLLLLYNIGNTLIISFTFNTINANSINVIFFIVNTTTYMLYSVFYYFFSKYNK